MKNYLLTSNSILYRCTQKFYDRQLSEYQIGSGQIQYLLLIYENEGISMQELAKKGAFDKGTITKGIQKLEEAGYIIIKTSVQDKRVKCLYTTDQAKSIISKVYEIRRQWWEHVTQGLSADEIELFEKMQNQMVLNAQNHLTMETSKVRFFGMQKLSLLDYPGKMACTLFTGGCNFKCPFCHNSDLVFLPENTIEISKDDIFNFLSRRKHILEAVCISGGEPLLHRDLKEVITEIKAMGYKVKLDTNGSDPMQLRELIEQGLVDYVAMDVKNSWEGYCETAGINSLDLSKINESIQILLQGQVDYEFRCTIVKEFHDDERIKQIGEWIQGAEVIYLQNFEDREQVIQKGLHAHEPDTLRRFARILSDYVKRVEIRGI